MKRRVLQRVRSRLARSFAGIDLVADVKRFTGVSPEVVFDVGAWIGKTVAECRTAWPSATVHAFEPGTEAFGRLRARFDGDPQVHAHNLALGAEDGTATLRVATDSSMSSLHAPVGGGPILGEQVVPVRSIDSFCSEHEIRRVDYLKVDAEGSDLEVLEGAAGMLGVQAVRFVQVEAGMNPTTGPQVPFGELQAFLAGKRYLLFGVYEQVHEWRIRAPQLRRANCVFVSPEVPWVGAESAERS